MAEEYTDEIPYSSDSLAEMVNNYFQQAKEYRIDDELVWMDAYDAYRASHPERTARATELAKSRGVYIHLVRRRVNSAKVKIGSLLFESGKVPFEVTPNLRPKFVSSDLSQLPYELAIEEIKQRAERMESEIRDVLRKSSYVDVINDTILEMCLYGTGVTKSIVLKKHNYPVYKTATNNPELLEAENLFESEMVPTVEHVSIWDIFPSPEAKSQNDCEWIIHRGFYSTQQLRALGTQSGFISEAIEEVIETGEGSDEGSDQSENPTRYMKRRGDRVKEYEVLEMWGDIPAEDLEPYMDIPEGSKFNLSVCVTVCGGKVLRAVLNPFDGRIPFDFCYWERNPDSVWGDGIYFSIRDLQDLTNFSFAQVVEAKALASNPMSVIDPQAFDEGEDLETIYPGKLIRLRPGNDVNSAYRPVIIPDVSNGLVELINMMERQADMASGQSAIGLGESSPYQTKTATGMSILQSNSNKLTAEVVRSVSNMISSNIQAIYHWLMADSEDNTLKGDYDCKSTGFMNYVAKEVHNTQLLNLLNVLNQNPDLREFIHTNKLVAPIFRAFSLEPEGIVMSQEEKDMSDQEAMLVAQQGLMAEMDAKNAQMREQAVLQEKMSVSSDQRKQEMLEREELMKQGNVLHAPPDFEGGSILLREEQEMELQQEMQAEIENVKTDQDLDTIEQELAQEDGVAPV